VSPGKIGISCPKKRKNNLFAGPDLKRVKSRKIFDSVSRKDSLSDPMR